MYSVVKVAYSAIGSRIDPWHHERTFLPRSYILLSLKHRVLFYFCSYQDVYNYNYYFHYLFIFIIIIINII